MGQREDNIGSLEDAASKRKARLLELKNRKRKKDAEEGDSKEQEQGSDDDALPTPQVLFRNYRPSSEALAEGVVDGAQPADVETLVEEQLEQARNHATAMQEVELSSLAPRKVTFDLKRGVEARLDRLERATDRAIAELIRERLKEEAGRGEHDLVAAVNAGAMAAREDNDEE